MLYLIVSIYPQIVSHINISMVTKFIACEFEFLFRSTIRELLLKN